MKCGARSEARSFDNFERADFKHLASLARADLAAFIQRNPRHIGLEKRLILIALCQGAATHHLDGTTGVKDFDIWMFFADRPGRPPYPVRRTGTAEFGGPRFQESSRRVDILGRTLPVSGDAEPVQAVQDYLAFPKTSTARHLSKKACIVLEPAARRGEIIWPR